MLYVTYTKDGATSRLTFPHSVLQSLYPDVELIKTPVTPRDVTIRGYAGRIGWGEPSNRNTPTPENKKDFNWIIDFEGTELLSRDIFEKRHALNPVLHIKTGEFQTAKLSPYRFLKVRDGVISDFGFVAETIGVEITVREGEHLVLRLNPGREISLDGVTDIKLDNVRPEHMLHLLKREKSETVHIDAQARHLLPPADDLRIYYEDLLGISDEREKVSFIPVGPEIGQALDLVSIPFVCFGTGGSVE